MEYGMPATLETPAGTLTFNDFTVPDQLRLAEFSLGKPVRVPVDSRPQQDGAIVSNSFRGAAFPMLRGLIATADLTVRSTMLDKIRSWPDSLRDADGTLKWTPTGKTQRRMTVRLLDDVQTRGDLMKEFQIALVAADPLSYADSLQSGDSSALTAGGGGALVFPVTFPFSFGDFSSGGTVAVTNGGEAATWPTVRIYGSISAPTVRNVTSGKRVSLPGLTISAGDYVEIDMRNGTVRLNGSADNSVLRYLDVSVSEFWKLAKGSNSILLSGSSFDATAKATVLWRDAYI